MSKRLIIVLATLVPIVIILLFAPFFMGVQAKQTLMKQHTLLQESVFFEVVSHEYNRGWFSSEEKTALRLKPSVVEAYKNMLPKSLQEHVGKTLNYTNHIYHGPFPRFSYVGRAYVETEFEFSEESVKEFEQFFKDKKPIVLTNKINFNGGGQLNLTIPATDYSELVSGVKVNWQGFQYKINYQNDYSNYLAEGVAPGIKMILADKGHVSFSDLKITADNREGKITGANLGSNMVSLGNLSLYWKDSVDYYLDINEVISFLSNIQVGAFINPRGKIGPVSLELDQFSFSTDVQENDRFLDRNWGVNFKKLTYGEEVYGPLQVKVAANHIDGKSFVAMVDKFKSIAAQNLDQEQVRAAMRDATIVEGQDLWTNNPQFKIESFKLQMPSGLLDVKGYFNLKDAKPEDLQDIYKLVDKIDIDLEGFIPKKAIENFAISNLQSVFKPDERAENQPDMEEISKNVTELIDREIESYQQQGMLTVDGGIIHTKVQRKGKDLYINGKRLVIVDEEENVSNELDESVIDFEAEISSNTDA